MDSGHALTLTRAGLPTVARLGDSPQARGRELARRGRELWQETGSVRLAAAELMNEYRDLPSLQAFRYAAGLSQDQAAARYNEIARHQTSLGGTTINAWETWARARGSGSPPPFSSLLMLAAAYGRRPLGMPDEELSPGDLVAEAFDRLPAEDQHAVRTFTGQTAAPASAVGGGHDRSGSAGGAAPASARSRDDSAALRAGLFSGIGAALDTRPETVRSYADRGLITRQQWNDIIDGSAERLWLYGMAEFGYASDDRVPGILTAAVARGCDVRVLLLDPDYPATGQIDADEGSPAGTLAARTRAALARFLRMQEACESDHLQIRVYDAHPSVSMVRSDDRMLVTPYLRFFIGSNSPTFEIHDGTAPTMFGRYEQHFRDTWENSRDWK
jgi:transcriptional regulator with XRE-family HTH domain